MIFSFDLISDLHRETWTNFDWSGMATAPFCIVAGDIARDRALVIDTLEQLSEVYHGVFYIDGNDEHIDYAEDLSTSYKELEALIEHIPKVVYLHNNVVIINDVAIVATNGWWSYDFNPQLEVDQSVEYVRNRDQISLSAAMSFNGVAYQDANYMISSVSKLQHQRDVKAIIVVTHTVPSQQFICHDLSLIDKWQFNSMGNNRISALLAADTQRKIKNWCFGHYHSPVDVVKDGIRYMSNPRGRGDTAYKQIAYYPKRVTINY